MPRPKSPFPQEKLHISIPQELSSRLRLMFFSENTQDLLIRGAMSKFISEAIREKLERIDRAKKDSQSPGL